MRHSPRPACGERSRASCERVRGILDRLELEDGPLTPILRCAPSRTSPRKRGEVKPARDSHAHLRLLAARCARVIHVCCPKRGRGECRALDAPAVSRAKWIESTRGSHHRFTRTTRHSHTQWFYGLFRTLPGDRAFLSPSPA